MNKLNSHAFGMACGIFWVIWDIIFFAFIIISPGFALNFISKLTLINLSTLNAILTWGNVISSIILGLIAGYATGYLFAAIYNLFAADRNDGSIPPPTQPTN